MLLWHLLPLQELNSPCPQGLGSLLGCGDANLVLSAEPGSAPEPLG